MRSNLPKRSMRPKSACSADNSVKPHNMEQEDNLQAIRVFKHSCREQGDVAPIHVKQDMVAKRFARTLLRLIESFFVNLSFF